MGRDAGGPVSTRSGEIANPQPAAFRTASLRESAPMSCCGVGSAPTLSSCFLSLGVSHRRATDCGLANSRIVSISTAWKSSGHRHDPAVGDPGEIQPWRSKSVW
jgi:hypothetical protein